MTIPHCSAQGFPTQVGRIDRFLLAMKLAGHKSKDLKKIDDTWADFGDAIVLVVSD